MSPLRTIRAVAVFTAVALTAGACGSVTTRPAAVDAAPVAASAVPTAAQPLPSDPVATAPTATDRVTTPSRGPLPLRPDGFGEVQPTPTEFVDRAPHPRRPPATRRRPLRRHGHRSARRRARPLDVVGAVPRRRR